ncbi:MAG: glycerol-3-phosphate dehydrogenase C-terminal domain-containing protein, partial [Bacteroidota bacterium]|nr:glycerol-3-phosphate dehydrogenase C-terminal domain-containing protein [Bacteroidota bacterium]
IAELNDEYKDFSKETINYLGKNYGTECHKIFNLARANKNLAHVVSGDGEILAEVEYAVKNEMAFTLSDIMFRRTGIGTLGYPGKEIFDELVNYASELLKWDEKRKNNEIDTVMQLLELPKK